MGKFLLVSSFSVLAPLTVILVITIMLFLAHSERSILGAYTERHAKTVAFAALPPASEHTALEIVGKDARVELIRQFFARYNSPLTPYAQKVVEAADKYSIDFRLIPAIAMQESTLCEKIPKNSYNCWGFGIYGKKVTRFDNYEEAIETVTKTLSMEYKADGLHTPEEIMKRYTPSSNGSWAASVSLIMNRLQ